MSKRIAQAVWCSVLLIAAGAAGAEDQGREPWDKGSLQIGGFINKYQNFRGSLVDTLLAIEYLPFKHVGFGLGVNAVRFHIEADSDNALGANLDGAFRYDFVGAMLYAKLFF